MQTLLAILLVLLSLFLILLILIQQGKGGGLAGAFGGMGGQSAFGTKAGDLFTKITIGVAGVWIVLCILLVRVTGSAQSGFSSSLGGNAPPTKTLTAPADAKPGTSTPAPSTTSGASDKTSDGSTAPAGGTSTNTTGGDKQE
jgi:preprotein translocase subunit SecG